MGRRGAGGVAVGITVGRGDTADGGGDGAEYITIEQARRAMRPPPGRSTMNRWARDGYPVGDQVIRLRVIRRGRIRLTTMRWVEDFTAACTAAMQARGPAGERVEALRRAGF